MATTTKLTAYDLSVSPLVLCDRLFTLDEDVDRAGLRGTAVTMHSKLPASKAETPEFRPGIISQM